MDQKDYEHKKLLEQYLLGLTSREQETFVEELLAKDPRAEEELEKLRGQLDSYISQQGMAELSGPARSRSSQDFHDLDHEMITQMTRRNHYLVIWRLALSAVCLILLFVSGYLFRENQNYRIAVNREKALHAQDSAAYRRQLQALEHADVNWDSLKTQTVTSDNGDVLVHFLAEEGTTFLDLSHLPAPDSAQAFYLSVISRGGANEVRLLRRAEHLKLLPLTTEVNRVRLLRGKIDTATPPDTSTVEVITDFQVVSATNGVPR